MNNEALNLKYIVRNDRRATVAGFAHIQDAVFFVAGLGCEATISTARCGILWCEGFDGADYKGNDAIVTLIEKREAALT
jgi:hypothetical protein